jgi:hypothetical protein
VSLPDELGGKRVRPILTEINNLLAADPAAPHFITVASSLRPDEIEYIANSVKRFHLEPGGQVHVFFNPCFPTVDSLSETAEALVCDFRGGSGVSALLTDFLLEKPSTAVANGFSQADRLALAGQVPERSLTEEIEQELQRLLETNHR